MKLVHLLRPTLVNLQLLATGRGITRDGAQESQLEKESKAGTGMLRRSGGVQCRAFIGCSPLAKPSYGAECRLRSEPRVAQNQAANLIQP